MARGDLVPNPTKESRQAVNNLVARWATLGKLEWSRQGGKWVISLVSSLNSHHHFLNNNERARKWLGWGQLKDGEVGRRSSRWPGPAAGAQHITVPDTKQAPGSWASHSWAAFLHLHWPSLPARKQARSPAESTPPRPGPFCTVKFLGPAGMENHRPVHPGVAGLTLLAPTRQSCLVSSHLLLPHLFSHYIPFLSLRVWPTLATHQLCARPRANPENTGVKASSLSWARRSSESDQESTYIPPQMQVHPAPPRLGNSPAGFLPHLVLSTVSKQGLLLLFLTLPLGFCKGILTGLLKSVLSPPIHYPYSSQN